MFDSIFFNGNEYNQMWLNGSMIWEKDSGGSGVVDEYPEYDTVVVYYVRTGSVASMLDSDYRPPKIDSSLSASYTHLWTDGKYQCYGLNNYYPSGQDNRYSNQCYPVQIRKVSLPKGVEYADGSLTLGSGSNKFIRYYCRNATSASSELYPPYIDWTFFDCRKVKEIGLLYDFCVATTIGNIGLWDTTYLTKTNIWGTSDALSKIPSLDLSGWNTSNIVNMSNTFYSCTTLSELNISTWNTSKVTSMSSMFYNCTSLKELDLTSFDTSAVTSYSNMFKGVSNCTIYIGDNWTLGTTATFGGGTNNTFIKYVPIETFSLRYENEEVTDMTVTTSSFTVEPIITPTDYTAKDLVVEYDSDYLVTGDNLTFYLLDGCQGKTLKITYRSRKNSIAKTIKVTVSEDLIFEEVNTLIDFTQPTAPTLPYWFLEINKDATYYFTHGTWKNDSSMYGLINKDASGISWNCYKLIAPKTGTLTFTYRAYGYNGLSDYPLTIHATTSTTQPSYNSATDRLVCDGAKIYVDGTATLEVTKGEVYYIHIQFKRSSYTTNFEGACIRSIELIPTE